MAQTYTVKLVSEDEWADLVQSDRRYEHVDDTNLGLTDPAKRRSYVRAEALKGFPGVKAMVARHEFEHLMEDSPTDEDEHGIRHKKGFWRNFLGIAAAPFTLGSSLAVGSTQQRPILGAPGNPVNRVANAVYQVAPAVAGGVLGGVAAGPPGAAVGAGAGSALGDFATGRPVSAGKAALSAGIAGVGSAALKAFSAPGMAPGPAGVGTVTSPQAGTLTLPASTAPRAASSTFSSGSAPSGPGATRFQLAPLTNPLGVPFRPGQGGTPLAGRDALNAFQMTPQVTPGGQPPIPPTPPPPTAQPSLLRQILGGAAGTGIGTALGSRFGTAAASTAAGAALAGLPYTGVGPQTPEVPNFREIPGIQQFEQRAESRYAPLVQRASELPNVQVPEHLAGVVRRQFQRQREQTASQFKMFRPNADIATDSDFQRVMADIDQREAESLATLQLQFMGEQRQNLTTQLGITRDELETFHGLAQLDIDTIMARTGLKAQEAAQFKQTFGELGAAVAGAGILGSFR